MKKIVLSHNLPLERFTDYISDMEVVIPKEPLSKFTREEIEVAVKDADILITIADFVCDKELIDLGKNLKVIGNLGSGFNNVDVAYATTKGIYVLNTPTAVMEPTAEMTIALILTIARSTARYDRDLRKKQLCVPTLLFERDMVVFGKTLGIIGFGRIGKAVAKKAVGLGMKILYADPYRADEDTEKALNATHLSAEEVIAESDVLTLHMPYTQEYYHYMNEEKISLMKNTAYLINASRGPIVEEAALVKALKNNQIRGAALDVHEFEPNISDEIAQLENIVITPHCCTNIKDIRLNMLEELMIGIKEIKNNNIPNNIVNRQLI